MVRDYQAAEARHCALRGCATCGVRDPRLDYHLEGAIITFDPNHWVRAPLQFVQRLAAVRFELFVRDGSSFRRVDATRLDLHHVCRVTGTTDGGYGAAGGALFVLGAPHSTATRPSAVLVTRQTWCRSSRVASTR